MAKTDVLKNSTMVLVSMGAGVLGLRRIFPLASKPLYLVASVFYFLGYGAELARIYLSPKDNYSIPFSPPFDTFSVATLYTMGSLLCLTAALLCAGVAIYPSLLVPMCWTFCIGYGFVAWGDLQKCEYADQACTAKDGLKNAPSVEYLAHQSQSSLCSAGSVLSNTIATTISCTAPRFCQPAVAVSIVLVCLLNYVKLGHMSQMRALHDGHPKASENKEESHNDGDAGTGTLTNQHNDRETFEDTTPSFSL